MKITDIGFRLLRSSAYRWTTSREVVGFWDVHFYAGHRIQGLIGTEAEVETFVKLMFSEEAISKHGRRLWEVKPAQVKIEGFCLSEFINEFKEEL